MENVTFISTTNDFTGETTEHAIIDHGNEQFTSMPKAVFEAQQAQAALSTPSV